LHQQLFISISASNGGVRRLAAPWKCEEFTQRMLPVFPSKLLGASFAYLAHLTLA